jgi:hypothetical protein
LLKIGQTGDAKRHSGGTRSIAVFKKENRFAQSREAVRHLMARPARLERATLGSASRCSIHLSYGRL